MATLHRNAPRNKENHGLSSLLSTSHHICRLQNFRSGHQRRRLQDRTKRRHPRQGVHPSKFGRRREFAWFGENGCSMPLSPLSDLLTPLVDLHTHPLRLSLPHGDGGAHEHCYACAHGEFTWLPVGVTPGTRSRSRWGSKPGGGDPKRGAVNGVIRESKCNLGDCPLRQEQSGVNEYEPHTQSSLSLTPNAMQNIIYDFDTYWTESETLDYAVTPATTPTTSDEGSAYAGGGTESECGGGGSAVIINNGRRRRPGVTIGGGPHHCSPPPPGGAAVYDDHVCVPENNTCACATYTHTTQAPEQPAPPAAACSSCALRAGINYCSRACRHTCGHAHPQHCLLNGCGSRGVGVGCVNLVRGGEDPPGARGRTYNANRCGCLSHAPKGYPHHPDSGSPTNSQQHAVVSNTQRGQHSACPGCVSTVTSQTGHSRAEEWDEDAGITGGLPTGVVDGCGCGACRFRCCRAVVDVRRGRCNNKPHCCHPPMGVVRREGGGCDSMGEIVNKNHAQEEHTKGEICHSHGAGTGNKTTGGANLPVDLNDNNSVMPTKSGGVGNGDGSMVEGGDVLLGLLEGQGVTDTRLQVMEWQHMYLVQEGEAKAKSRTIDEARDLASGGDDGGGKCNVNSTSRRTVLGVVGGDTGIDRKMVQQGGGEAIKLSKPTFSKYTKGEVSNNSMATDINWDIDIETLILEDEGGESLTDSDNDDYRQINLPDMGDSEDSVNGPGDAIICDSNNKGYYKDDCDRDTLLHAGSLSADPFSKSITAWSDVAEMEDFHGNHTTNYIDGYHGYSAEITRRASGSLDSAELESLGSQRGSFESDDEIFAYDLKDMRVPNVDREGTPFQHGCGEMVRIKRKYLRRRYLAEVEGQQILPRASPPTPPPPPPPPPPPQNASKNQPRPSEHAAADILFAHPEVVAEKVIEKYRARTLSDSSTVAMRMSEHTDTFRRQFMQRMAQRRQSLPPMPPRKLQPLTNTGTPTTEQPLDKCGVKHDICEQLANDGSSSSPLGEVNILSVTHHPVSSSEQLTDSVLNQSPPWFRPSATSSSTKLPAAGHHHNHQHHSPGNINSPSTPNHHHHHPPAFGRRQSVPIKLQTPVSIPEDTAEPDGTTVTQSPEFKPTRRRMSDLYPMKSDLDDFPL